MEEDAAPLGFSEVPPGQGKGQEHLRTEAKPHPVPDRPVYSVPQEEESSDETEEGGKDLRGGFLRVAGAIIGIAALMAVAAFFYKMNADESLLANRPAGLSAAIGTTGLESLKIETERTMEILNEAAVEHSGQPEKLGEIETMKKEAQSILDSMGDKK